MVSLSSTALPPWPRRREALGIRLEGSAVIVDEGHNLADAVASTYSAVLTERQLNGALSALSAYLSRFRPQLSAANLRHLSLLESLAKAFSRALSGAVKLGGGGAGAAASLAASGATEARGGPAGTSGRGEGSDSGSAAAARAATDIVGLNEFLLRTGTDNVDLFRLCAYTRESKARTNERTAHSDRQLGCLVLLCHSRPSLEANGRGLLEVRRPGS